METLEELNEELRILNNEHEFNTSIKDAIEELDAEFKSHKCRTCGGQMYCIALNCADSVNDDIEEREFIRQAAQLAFARNIYGAKECWERAKALWDTRPPNF